MAKYTIDDSTLSALADAVRGRFGISDKLTTAQMTELLLGVQLSEDLVPVSIDTDGSIYNDCGYMEGFRNNSSGTLSKNELSIVTGYIPVTEEDYIFVSTKNNEKAYFYYLSTFDEEFNQIGYATPGFGYCWSVRLAGINAVTSWPGVKYVRVTITGNINNRIAPFTVHKVLKLGDTKL